MCVDFLIELRQILWKAHYLNNYKHKFVSCLFVTVNCK